MAVERSQLCFQGSSDAFSKWAQNTPERYHAKELYVYYTHLSGHRGEGSGGADKGKADSSGLHLRMWTQLGCVCRGTNTNSES
jgi:hypothetical protein